MTVADETVVAPNPDELIRMKHPGLGGVEVATTSRLAFDTIWAAKGWQVVADDGTVLDAAPVVAETPAGTPVLPAGKVDTGAGQQVSNTGDQGAKS